MLFRPSAKGRKKQEKGEKGRFRPISGKGGRTPLKPPFVTPTICGSPKTVPVPRSLPGKTVPTVPFSGSGSVPGPP